MCSQPIEHDAQLSRATPRASASSSAASRGASANVAAWKLRVGSVAMALKASRLASVPSSRYFAVAGPNERARRSRAAASTAGGSAGATLRRRADGDRLEALRAEHRAEAAAAGVAAVVGDGRVADEPLARRADRRDAPGLAEPLAQPRLGLRGGQPPEVAGGLEARRRRRRRAGPRAPSQAPRTTIASWPVSLPAIAKWLEASASLSRPVSGDFATTANFALVVSGVPTSGEKQKASGASGPSGSTPGGRELGA